MPGYNGLLKYTSQGIADIKESPVRIEQGKAKAEKMGISVVGAWITMGQYDLVIVGDAPDDKTMAAFMLALGGQGNVTTQTMRAFSEDEFKEVVGKLG